MGTDFLRAAELKSAERSALAHGVTVRRDQGGTLHVTPTPTINRQFLVRRRSLGGGAQGIAVIPERRKTRREHETHVNAL